MEGNLGAPSMSVETSAAGVLTAIRAILENPRDIEVAVISRLQI
jgi:pyroglutamyl-peptidase